MFSAVSLEGIINSKKFKKIQKLGNLVLFVDEIICAKFEVIWRWSKKCPHSGGTIWRRGVVYIECAKTPASPRYKEFNVHKEGALQVTSIIKWYKWSLSLWVNARPLLCKVTLDLLSVEWFLLRSSDIESSEWNAYGWMDDDIPRMLLALGWCPRGGYLGQAYDPTLGT